MTTALSLGRLQLLPSCLLLFAFLVPFPISAQQVLPTAVDEQVDHLAADEMASLHEPSLAISIVNDGKLIFAKGYGVSDIENNVPATADSVYRVALKVLDCHCSDAARRRAQVGPGCAGAEILPGIPNEAVAHHGARGTYTPERHPALQER